MRRSLLFGCLAVSLAAAVLVWARAGRHAALDLPGPRYNYTDLRLPEHLAQSGRHADNTPPDNPLTDHGATLGRVLFYDTRLSANNTTSCASCHQQAHAFGDPRPRSRGFRGALTDRRAMPLVNLRYYQRARFFWDERGGNLEEMVLLPIQSRIEMGQDMTTLVESLARDSSYAMLFQRAFGDPVVSDRRIARALAQFVRSMVSYQSRYDEGRARAQSPHDDFNNFTRQENRGKALFLRNCAHCHMPDGDEHFFVPEPANTGLRPDGQAPDGGVGDVTLRIADRGAFRSPSLRNVAVTAPYGHDGRFSTLEAIIDHYSENAVSESNSGHASWIRPLRFTKSEEAALSAFLRTLTDAIFLSDAKFSSPAAGSTVPRAQADAGVTDAVIIRAPGPVSRQTSSNSQSLVGRLLSFDANEDSRIARDELPERMEGLVGRGDRNQDEVLSIDEIFGLAGLRTPRHRVRPLTGHTPGSLKDVLADLKLPKDTHYRAVMIVTEEDARGAADLYENMRRLLTSEDYRNFVAADRRRRSALSAMCGTAYGNSANAVGPSHREIRSRLDEECERALVRAPVTTAGPLPE